MDNQILSIKPRKGYGFVYQYISPNGKMYIGQTKTSLKERAGIKGKKYKGCTIFYNAIKKYGWDSFQVKILKEVPLEYLGETEVQMILYYDTCNHDKGYNIVSTQTEWMKALNSVKVYCYEKDTGLFVKEYESISAAERSFDVFHGSIRRVLNHPTRSAKNFYWRTEKTEKIVLPTIKVQPNSKKVYMYDSVTGQFLQEFCSIREAAIKSGYNRWTIQEHVSRKKIKRGKKHTFRDFKVNNLYLASPNIEY